MIIRAITKSKRKQKHIYKVYLWDNRCLTIIFYKDRFQGHSHWNDVFGYNDAVFETGYIGNDRMVNWYQVPSVIQSHIEYCIESGRKEPTE